MIWEEASYLWLLLVIPLTAGGYWWYQRYLQKKRRKYFSDELFAGLRRGYWTLGDRLQLGAFFLALLFFGIALAGPKVGTEVREVKRQGVEMVVALDLSASMNAEDIRPSRLGKAKYEIQRLVERLEGDRVGLVVFSGDAFLQAPMTMDYSALRMFLNIAETSQMPSTGTDFGEAMRAAFDAFESDSSESGSDQPGNGSRASKVLLVVSDGEDHGESYEDELEQLVQNDISVYTLGIGTRSGARVPIFDEESGNRIAYKRDNRGQEVNSALQPETLRRIAQSADGSYYEITRGSDGIDSFLRRMDELEQGEFSNQEYADFKNQYQWLGGIGLFFLLVSMIVNNYRRES